MTEAEREALELLNEVREERGCISPYLSLPTSPISAALIRAIEERNALRADMAEIDRIAVECGWGGYAEGNPLRRLADLAAKHRAEPDPLVEAAESIVARHEYTHDGLRNAVSEALKRGIELAREENDNAR